MCSPDHPSRLLLVDDHAVFRESLRAYLAGQPDFQIVGDCGTPAEAAMALSTEPVDAVLLDFDLRTESGDTVLDYIRNQGIQTRVLLVAGALTDGQALALIRKGIAGIFLKDRPLGELLGAIRHVVSGGNWVDQRFMPALMGVAAQSDSPDRLTDKERDVLRGVVAGLSNKEIGVRINASEPAVKATLQRLFEKAGVRTRAQIVRVALERYRDQL